MSDSKDDTSDVKKAAERADAQKIQENLADNQAVDNEQLNDPAVLSEDEQTSFINDDLRTDK